MFGEIEHSTEYTTFENKSIKQDWCLKHASKKINQSSKIYFTASSIFTVFSYFTFLLLWLSSAVTGAAKTKIQVEDN